MNKFRLYGILLLLLLITCTVRAQSGWSVDEKAYQYDMTYYLSITDEDGNVVADLNNYEVGAFVGDECRGLAEVLEAGNKQYMYIRVRSNSSSGDKFKFKVFDLNAGEETPNKTSEQTFTSNGLQGMPSNPFMIELGENNVLLGDADDNGVVNLTDAVVVFNYYMGSSLPKFNAVAADFDCNGSINLTDAVLIFNFYMNH